MKVLVLNSGSSSIKFQLFEMDKGYSIAGGIIEQIGSSNALAKIEFKQEKEEKKIQREEPIKNHLEGLKIMDELLRASGKLNSMHDLAGIGHRVVHGGEHFSKPTLIDERVIEGIASIIPLAPLHNPAHLDGIKVTMKQCPNVPQVAVFDTAFHASIPKHAYMYALPFEYYEEDGVRKYGFHGTSHYYVMKETARFLSKDINELNAITLHLGNGASMAAIKEGKCIDTSMGLTPLEGLIMGTRSGDLDPAILFYLARKHSLSIDDLDTMLNKKSGLKGICGNNDMRQVEELAEEGNDKAKLALDMFAYRIKKYIGAYSAALGRVDAIVFTGGIGENDIDTRVRCCENLENLGIKIHKEANNRRAKEIIDISESTSSVKTLVVPTNEELEIALQTKELLG